MQESEIRRLAGLHTIGDMTAVQGLDKFNFPSCLIVLAIFFLETGKDCKHQLNHTGKHTQVGELKVPAPTFFLLAFKSGNS